MKPLTMSCPGCNALMDLDAIFCNECGLAVPEALSVKESESSARPTTTFSNIGAREPAFDVQNAREMKSCPKCAKELKVSVRFCSSCAYAFPVDDAHEPAPAKADATSETFSEPDGVKIFPQQLVIAVKQRYRDGYLYARTFDGIGSTIKALGFLLGGIVVFVGIVAGGGIASALGPGRGGETGIILGFVVTLIGILIAIVLWVIGLIIKAGAQFLKAELDGAVYESPFLTDYDKAEVMSLPMGGDQKKTLKRNARLLDEEDNQRSDEYETVKNTKAAAAYGLGFLLGIFWLPVPIYFAATSAAKNKVTRFHSYQAIVLIVGFLVANLLITGIGLFFRQISFTIASTIELTVWLIWFLSFGVFGFAIWKAYNNELYVMPIVGDIATKLMGSRDEVSVSIDLKS